MHTPFLPSHHHSAKPRSIAIALTTSAVAVAFKRRIEPLPLDQWPDWAKDLAQHCQPADTGLGDTVVHAIGDTRSEKFKEWFQEKIGKSCGCSERQRWLNARFPYPSKPAAAALQTK